MIWNHIWNSGRNRGFVPDGIYTGFLSDEKQADKILKFMDMFAAEDTLILTDPVMGDDGEVYPIYTEALRRRFCELVKRSCVITPNLTEALVLLYGKEKMKTVWKEFQTITGQERLELNRRNRAKTCRRIFTFRSCDHRCGSAGRGRYCKDGKSCSGEREMFLGFRGESRRQLFRYWRYFCIDTQCRPGKGILYGGLCGYGSGLYFGIYQGCSERGY